MSRARTTPPRQETIETLLALSRSELILEQMYVGPEQTIRGSVKHLQRDPALSPEQQRAMRRVPARVIAILREECNWSLLRSQLVAQYTKSFDQEAIDRLIWFYRSFAGRAYQETMPALVQGSMALAQAQTNLFLQKMEPAMDKAVREAKRVRKRAAVSPAISPGNQVRRAAQR